jgi:hypothetical protein
LRFHSGHLSQESGDVLLDGGGGDAPQAGDLDQSELPGADEFEDLPAADLE